MMCVSIGNVPVEEWLCRGVGPSPGQWSVWQMPGVTAEVTTTTHPNTPQE